MTDPQDIDTTGEVLSLAAEIVAAYASRNQMAQGDLPALIHQVHATLAGLSGQRGVNLVDQRRQLSLIHI